MSTCKKNKFGPLPNTIYKNKLKMVKYLNVRPKKINLLEENMGQKLHDLGFGNDFLDMTPKAWVRKEKINKVDSMKIKKFCASKDTINKVKR